FAEAPPQPTALRWAQRAVPLALLALWFAAPRARAGWLAACGIWALLGTTHGALLLVRRALAPLDERPESPNRTRLRCVAAGHAGLPFAVLVDLVAWHVGQPRILTLLGSLFCFYLGYLNLARIRVKDLRQLMGDAVGLTCMAAGLSGAFSMLWLWGGA